MIDYREILRLDKENHSQRQIEASTWISRHTVTVSAWTWYKDHEGVFL